MARPPKEISAEDVEKLAQLGCNNTEIANFMECSVDTITRRFADNLVKGRAVLRISLRRLQWQSAQKGNIVMQIWLGKQYLGQAEKQEIVQDVKMDISDAERKARIERIKKMAKESA